MASSSDRLLDIGDDSLLSTSLSLKLLQHPKLTPFPIDSLEEKTGSLLLWRHIISSNKANNTLIPSLSSTDANVVVWDGHQYQMEDHCVMAGISYWCRVNRLRGEVGRGDAF